MKINIMAIILLVIELVILLIIESMKNIKSKSETHYRFKRFLTLLAIPFISLPLQIMFENVVNPIYFDYATYIFTFYGPIELLFAMRLYKNPKVDNKKLKFLYIISTLFLIVLWTNSLHSGFYEVYSTNFGNTVYGPIFYPATIYCYIIIMISAAVTLVASIKRSGFFSGQSMLIILGILVPVIGNILGVIKIINMTIYITPILLAVTAICFYIAVIRLKALNVVPIALKAIVDNMSDAFVVISEDGTIADLNKTFVEKFKVFGEIKNKDNLFDILKTVDFISLTDIQKDIAEAVEKETTITKEYHIEKGVYDRYFEVDFQPVKSKDGTEYVATLILLRDVTQAKKDMEAMLKNESLVMLGELAGGVAHDINTPISAIKSGLLIFKSTAKSDDEKMLVERMDSCANKIVTLTNSLRNQIRNIGSNEISDVNITSVIKDVSVIIHNELTKHRVNLNLDIKKDLVVKGNSAKLSQVVTNIIVNAVQAYEDKGGEVNVVVDEKNNNAVISIEDFAGGIPEHIRDNIGKNILTTKGVNGTGFGLYLAFSVITGAFGGEITFDTEEGKGTTFYITIPLK